MRESVRASYASVARAGGAGGCCAPSGAGPEAASCCGGGESASAAKAARALGYSEEELAGMPEGANMGLGCGNPQALASIRPGETVLDLGSGGGFDAFLALRRTGPRGKVIGVDMTHEMLDKARANAAKLNAPNVEFRLGEIEHLPVADGTVDVVISNCVINLSPDKGQVFREAYRVLKSGGRLAISDVVACAGLPEEIRRDVKLLSGCIAGAAGIDEVERMLTEAGFEDVRIVPKEESRDFIRDWAPGRGVEQYVVSADIRGVKP
ncbi:MAG: arsenite methyltransferase [Elusimicrobia bacterium]|nr:arsenite methyltransferase [Elusimicrobiota bacterium]